MDRRRVIANVLAVVVWIAVWALCLTVGMRIATRLLPPASQDGYQAVVGLLGVLILSPIGLFFSTYFLLTRRSIPIFVTCGALVGLGIALAPLLPWPTW